MLLITSDTSPSHCLTRSLESLSEAMAWPRLATSSPASLYGLCLVVEDDGPRLVFRYANRRDDGDSKSSADSLLETLEASALAKLFCTKRALREVILELEIDDLLFLSYPTTLQVESGTCDVERGDEEPAMFWGDDINVEHFESGRRLAFFNVVWVAHRSRVCRQSLTAAARAVAASLGHEEKRCGYVSRESAKMLSAEGDGLQAKLDASSLARELKQACDAVLGGRVGTEGRIQFNRWIEARFEVDDRQRCDDYEPYEALIVAKKPLSATELPICASPQLRALLDVAHPTVSFAKVAARSGLPLDRVYCLARHVVASKRARVFAAIDDDSVFAVSPNATFEPAEATVLAAFGACARFADALQKLRAEGFPDACDTVFKAVSDGKLIRLHTYVHRIEGAPSADLEAAVAAAVVRRQRDHRTRYDHDEVAFAVSPSSYDDYNKPFEANALLRLFRLLSPYFDGRHSLLDMSFKESVPLDEIHAVLNTFKGLLVTIQR